LMMCVLAASTFCLCRYLGLRHLPVVDEGERLQGILTRNDILESSVEALNERYFPKRGH
jgi:CBS domain-containing protein